MTTSIYVLSNVLSFTDHTVNVGYMILPTKVSSNENEDINLLKLDLYNGK